jgi:hypothetical protein
MEPKIIIGLIGIFLLIAIFVKINHVIKNQVSIMASLSDFQAQAARIDTATTDIKATLAGQGMSAADSDAALKVVQDATDALVQAVTPTPPPATP